MMKEVTGIIDGAVGSKVVLEYSKIVFISRNTFRFTTSCIDWKFYKRSIEAKYSVIEL